MIGAADKLSEDRRASLSYLQERPTFGGPLCVLDPEGRTRTGISALDRRALCQLSYLGVVRQMIRLAAHVRKALFPPCP
jgi:hypothetical protein